MKKYRYASVILTILSLMACQPDTKGIKHLSQDKYENLPAYFTGEKQRLRNAGITLHKTVTINGQTDTATINSKDSSALQDLLKPFADMDLNKPSLRDEYDSNTMTDQFSGNKTVIYKSKGKQTNPEEIILEIDRNGTIQQVSIQSYTSNMVYEFRQQLTYLRDRSIRIASHQKIAFLAPKDLEITVTKNQM
ncbi:hypothetical protein [Chitinophaga vietnamensis]|uniref:hypothetical protein n=1 Tax=Chitinophaga vietnamensis TaxID=2593957 RepID=UPI0011780174|nr:hypothetical protein [Chitinophaga vietnamensis]